MTISQSIILGLIQGLTEFLPVSSSGHLVIFQHLLNLSEPPVVFDVLVHLATSLAIIIVLFKSLIKITLKQITIIVVASLPAAIIGLLLNSQIEQLFSSLKLVSFALLITAAFLFSTKLQPKADRPLDDKNKKINFKNSILIGFSQALAIIPGISRSGSTIVTGLHTGLSPSTAFNFSFMLSLPAIFGAQLLQINKLASLSSLELPSLIIGFITAFASGLLALNLLKRFVINGKLHYFGYYCLVLSALTLFI
jgi:undecaprenyl-diphosphatase